jgi:PKD repeat protein
MGMAVRTLVMPLMSIVVMVFIAAHVSAQDTDGPAFSNDVTPTTGTTGDPFTFVVDVEDPSGLLLVVVEYTYGDAVYIEGEMEVEAPYSNTWSYLTSVPLTADEMSYRFYADDFVGNRGTTEWKHVHIADNDPPTVLSDDGLSFAEPGKAYEFRVELSDNIEMGSAWVHHWFDSQPPQNLTMQEGHPYTAQVQVPQTGVGELSFFFEAVDRLGNSLRTEVRKVPVVMDMTPPVFGRDSTPATGATGDDFRFLVEATDDLHLYEVRVLYRFGESTISNRSMKGENPYHLTVKVPMDSTGSVNYSFFASDNAGNQANTPWKHAKVRDNDHPVANAGLDLTIESGHSAILNGTRSWDNIGVVEYIWTFNYRGNVVTLNSSRSLYIFRHPGNYTVTLKVVDAEGFEDEDSMTVTVKEIAEPQPSMEQRTPQPEMTFLERYGVYILMAVVVVAWGLYRWNRQRVRQWPTGPRSTSSRSQVGYTSTRKQSP